MLSLSTTHPLIPLLQLSHKASKSSPSQVRRLVSQVDGSRLWETHLRPILIERLPGTLGSQAVRQVSGSGGLGDNNNNNEDAFIWFLTALSCRKEYIISS